MKTQYFQRVLYFGKIDRPLETQFQASNGAFIIFLKWI